jgi:hypothetical protein
MLHNYMLRPNNRPKHVVVKLIVQDSAIIKKIVVFCLLIVYYIIHLNRVRLQGC